MHRAGRPTAVLVAAILATLVAAGPGLAQEEAAGETGTVVGRVLDEGGGSVSGVRIIAVSAGYSGTTGPDGRFRIESAAEGAHRLIVIHPRFGADTARATVAAGMTTGLTLRYGPDGGLSRSVRLGGLPEDTAAGRRTGRSRIVGRLIDRDSSDPIASASVLLPSVDRQARSGDDGRFVFDSLPSGTYTVRVDHIRYGEQTAEVEVPDDRTVEAELRLAPEAVEVEPIEVSVDVRSPGLSTAGYYERRELARKQGRGYFLEGEQIQRRGNQIGGVLSTVPRLEMAQFGNTAGGASNLPYFPRHKDFTGLCTPAIYIDGGKVVGSGDATDTGSQFGPRGINSLVNLSSVAAIEVYASAAELPADFLGSDTRCGAIVIWTERGGS